MFEALIVKPIFNLLVLIYSLLPGHNFGLSIIIFTVVVRLLMWPLVKKQLHHTKAMRELQPDIKRIKQATKGNKQQESIMLMALYKERQISPFSSIGILVVQIIILLGLYQGLTRVVANPQALIDNSYTWLRDLGWVKELASNINLFDTSLFGVIDLTKTALPKGGGVYWPAMMIVLASAAAQYYQSKQLMPDDKQSRSLRTILREAGSGKQADQTEVQAATGRTMRYFIPVLIFVISVNLAAAISLYWLVSGVVAYIQQARVLNQDKEEMTDIADKGSKKTIIEGEVVEKPKSAKKKGKAKKRRKK